MPVLRIKSGDRVVTAVVDDTGVDARGTTVAQGPNPQTGPFFIEGASRAICLVVTIEKLETNRATGTSAALTNGASIDPGSISSRGDNGRVTWTIDAAKGVVRFDSQAVGRTGWQTRFEAPVFEMPLAPALASVSVAPAGQDLRPDDDCRTIWRKHERGGHHRGRASDVAGVSAG